MKPQKLRAQKKVQKLHGSLLQPLIVGKPAVFVSGGKIYHTSRVIRLHEQTQEKIHFETTNTHYHLTAGPSPVAATLSFPVRLAMCA